MPPEIYPQPQTIAANPSGGYEVSPISGDSIKPIIIDGDTAEIGVPIVAIGKVIPLDSVAKPKNYPVSSIEQLTKIVAHPNVFNIPKGQTVITVNKDSLPRIFLKKISNDDTLHYILDVSKSRIRTGIPIPIKGKKEKVIQPKPTQALPPVFKDDGNYDIKYLDKDHGLTTDFVQSIIEDRRGNLWIGTSSGSLSVYDGKSFRHFTEKEGLKSNSITDILEDRNGNIWFASFGGGASFYDGDSITHFTYKEGLTSGAINSIFEDSKGQIWLGTSFGVSVYNGQTITHFTKKEGLSHNKVIDIYEDKKGNIWLATFGGGANVYDGKCFTHYTEKEGLIHNNVRSILEDKNGIIWLATDSGVSAYDGKSFTHFTQKEGLTDDVVLSILEDKHGDIWFGTVNNGVIVYNGHSFTHFTEKEGLSNNFVTSILEDKNGHMWFGTGGGGVSKYNRKSFSYFSKIEDNTYNSVWSILETKNGQIWVSSWDGGVSVYDGHSFKYLAEKDGFKPIKITSFLEDKNGHIWLGSYGEGVLVFNGNSFTHFTEKEGLSSNYVTSILEDKNGHIWLATHRGINKYDGKSFTHFTQKEGLIQNSVNAIIEDKNGHIWAGTGSGISRYDGKYFTNFNAKAGLSNRSVFSILEARNGHIWFGTSGEGVIVYDGKTFTHITEKEGLSNNVVHSIAEDKNGNTYIATQSGLTILGYESGSGLQTSKGKNITKGKWTVKVLGKQNGLKETYFSRNGVRIDSKNRLWLGTMNNLTMADLNTFQLSQMPPTINLKQIDINDQVIDYHNISDSLAKEISFKGVQKFENYPLSLVLPHYKNSLTFHFTGIDWFAPEKILYSYRMLELNENWSTPSKEAKANYRNLAYGNYTFLVRALGESGEWSDSLAYTFTINPPWWHTWWARTIYLLTFILSIVGFFRWRTAALIKRQKELETEVDNATIEIRKQNQEIKLQKEQVEKEKERSESLLLNILPEEVAEELKLKGTAEAVHIDQVSVLFTDFKGFTAMSEKVTPQELVSDLHNYFSAFDEICEKYNIEKIKTIGDAYMAAGGLPSPNTTHPEDVVEAALEIAEIVKNGKAEKIAAGLPHFEIRIGVHTGPVVAGIVGVKKFQYDIWGDTVNTASRMQSSGEVGKVNISQSTYELLKANSSFKFESRGKIEAKGKGEIEMYFVSKT